MQLYTVGVLIDTAQNVPHMLFMQVFFLKHISIDNVLNWVFQGATGTIVSFRESHLANRFRSYVASSVL